MNASELKIFLGRIGILRARGWWSPRRGLAATACLLLLAGCGGSGSSGPSLDLSGTYRINGQSSRVGRFSATASVSQSGRSVTGSYQTSRGGAARLNGSVDGTHVNAQLIGTNSPGVCSFEADFFPDGPAGQGSYGCNDGETGSFTTARAK